MMSREENEEERGGRAATGKGRNEEEGRCRKRKMGEESSPSEKLSRAILSTTRLSDT